MDDARKTRERLISELAEARQRVAEQGIVNEIGQLISYASDLDELLETIQQQVSRLFDTTNFYIAVYREGSDEWMSVLDMERGERQPRARYKVDSGVTGHIIRTRQPVLWRSADEGRAFVEVQGVTSIGEMAMSWLGVPLVAADRVVGVMAIQSYEQEGLYDDQDLALLSMIAAQIAPALNNMRLLEETRRRAWELEVLNEVGRAFTSVLDLNDVLREVVDTTKARFGLYYVAIALVEGDRLVLRSGSTIGDSDAQFGYGDLEDVVLLRGASLVAETAWTGQLVLANDVLSDPRYLAVDELPKTRSELCVPIKARGRVIGVLDVQSDKPFAFSQSDATLLQSVANQAAVALENARLYKAINQELAERRQIEESLRESQETFKTILDSIDATVYVADFDTYEVLFMNRHMQESFGEDFTGQICYQVFRRESKPCGHCTNDQLLDANGEPTGVCVWEGQNPLNGSWYINYDRAIKWTDGRFVRLQIATDVTKVKQAEEALQQAYDEVEKRVEERTDDLQREIAKRERLQQEVIEAQKQALQELSTPIIPVMDRIIVSPLIGSIDGMRARDITRSLLAGIRQHRAKVVILDITGVPIVDSGVADHLNKTIQAARLKGARTIVTGVSDAVAETIVDLGIDWGSVETLGDLETGLRAALARTGRRIVDS